MNNGQKVAIITGASQGIGAGFVEGFLRTGYRVVATSRSIAQSADDRMLAIPGDIADWSTAEKVIDAAMEHFGRIDTLVNNAGIFLSKPVTEFTRTDFEAAMGVNLVGSFRITQLAVEQMKLRNSGHVVSITTSLVDHARSAVPAALAAITKGALNALTRSLAIEHAARGIRVNAVSPGVVDTPMHAREHHGTLAQLHPLGRLAQVDDVVAAVLYLEAATFVTGEILHVDGGQSAGH